MDKFKDKYRIPSARLQNFDYGSHGLYFVTICTKNRECYFGDIVTVETQNFASLRTTEIGNVAIKNWKEIPQHFPFVELDEFKVMPNHVHGILFFNKPDYEEWKPNAFGPQSQNLGLVMRGYKASVTKYATMNQLEFEWQERFYDRVIRDENELQRIREYVFNNPDNWINDRNNSENLFM